jgi:hypothetical protein
MLNGKVKEDTMSKIILLRKNALSDSNLMGMAKCGRERMEIVTSN